MIGEVEDNNRTIDALEVEIIELEEDLRYAEDEIMKLEDQLGST